MASVFILRWREIAKRRVKSLPVVKDLDPIEDLSSSLLASSEVLVVNELGFERAKEAFHDRVVPAVAFSAHAGGNAV